MKAQDVARIVGQLRPGERVEFDLTNMKPHPLMTLGHNGERWSAAECVLENVIGSCYTHRFYENRERHTTTFERVFIEGKERTWTPPDRVRKEPTP